MRRLAASVLGFGLLVGACTAPAPASDSPESDAPPAAPAVMEPLAEDTMTGEAQPDMEPLADGPQAGDVKPDLDPLDRVEDTCGLDALKPHLGKNALDIPPEIVPDTARIIGPDTNVTMDYVPTRLNILTNEDGVIIGLKCG